MSYTVDELKEKMCAGHIWHVVFTKKNGQTRTMNASRDWKFLRKYGEELGYKSPTNMPTYDADSAGVVRVWDCDEQDWRCIYAAGVQSIENIETEESVVEESLTFKSEMKKA